MTTAEMAPQRAPEDITNPWDYFNKKREITKEQRESFFTQMVTIMKSAQTEFAAKENRTIDLSNIPETLTEWQIPETITDREERKKLEDERNSWKSTLFSYIPNPNIVPKEGVTYDLNYGRRAFERCLNGILKEVKE